MESYADGRVVFGVPNFFDVVSNVPFLVVGAMGLRRAVRAGRDVFEAPWERWAAALLFGGVTIVAFGSAYFHLDPTNDRLVWDRLPMTLAFTSLVALVVGDRASERAGRMLLAPLVVVGAASVVFWRLTGIVWPYAVIQYGPLVAFPALLVFRRPRYSGAAYLVAALAGYVVAKVFEVLDREIFALGQVVSGHTLKHLAAAASTWCLYRMIASRRPLTG